MSMSTYRWYSAEKREELDGPWTRDPKPRQTWVEDAGKRTALEYKSYMESKMSKNTIHKMLLPENLAAADTDFSGTLDKKEFSELLNSSGVERNSAAMQAQLLFSAADNDGDGELTVDEIKTLVGYGRTAAADSSSSFSSSPSKA